ncbi:MAG: SDR family oxidoreductase [Bryobacterales bacterium]|nr:SDR family oxidoreductase [Bryobacterales bacterium]
MNILVTGTTGIAAATAELGRGAGHQVFLAGLPTYDFTKPASAESALQDAIAECGSIDGLFNVAGASGRRFGDGPAHECSDDGWRFTLDTNLTTAFNVSRAVLQYWIANKRQGAIVNIASVLADYPESTHFATHAYATAKGGLISLTKSMASYYANFNIRVNAIAPGLVRTPMSARAQSDSRILKFIQSKQPLAHDLLSAEDIARSALFLLSPESRYITGEVLTIDAGWRFS